MRARMTPSRLVVQAAVLTTWLLGGTGCSLVVKTDSEQCTVDADCTARGAAFANTVCTEHVCVAQADPKWGCIGSVAPLTGTDPKTFKMQFVDSNTHSPVNQNLTVKLCNKVDPDCS